MTIDQGVPLKWRCKCGTKNATSICKCGLEVARGNGMGAGHGWHYVNLDYRTGRAIVRTDT